MKKISVAFFFFIVFFGFISQCFGQQLPVYKRYAGSLEYQIPFPSNYPPLRTDMPYDVLLGYVYFDSIARTCEYDSLMTMINNMTYSDTLKYAIKYLYKLNDYDPLTFFQYQFGGTGSHSNKVSPTSILLALSRRAAIVYPDSFVSAGLCLVDAILDINVTDTLIKIDSSLPFQDKVVLVTASVLDTIKGKVLPSCTSDIYGIKRSLTQKNIVADNCLQFEYRLGWQKDIHSSNFILNNNTLYDTSGKAWIQKGKEYIVFLAFINMGNDSTNNYATFYPGLQNSSYIGLYPIEDGKVLDENNDFGFGTGLTVSEFKSKLRQKIQTILLN